MRWALLIEELIAHSSRKPEKFLTIFFKRVSYLQLLVDGADDLVAVQCLDRVNRSVDLFGRDQCQLKKDVRIRQTD